MRGFKTSMGEKHYVNGGSFHLGVQENSEGTMGRRAHACRDATLSCKDQCILTPSNLNKI